MKKKLLAVFVTVAMAVAVGVLGVACTKTKPVQYTVTFDYNYDGADPATVDVKVKDGDKVSKPTDPTRTDYNFAGWKKDGVDYDFDTPVKSDLTLKAAWTKKGAAAKQTYSVTFPTDGGVKFTTSPASIPAAVEENTEIKFEIAVSPYYEGTAVVKLNGTEMQPGNNGVYSFTVTSDVTVTVDGLTEGDKAIGGKGTKAEPYTIGTPAQWLGMVEQLNAKADEDDEDEIEDESALGERLTYYELTANLDFNNFEVPYVKMLALASFNGNGKSLKNARVTEVYSESFEQSDGSVVVQDCTGLFACAAYAQISDLKLKGFKLDCASDGDAFFAGAVVGLGIGADVTGVTLDDDCYITVGGGQMTVVYVGGIVGALESRTTAGCGIAYCTSAATVELESDVLQNGDQYAELAVVGGIVGTVDTQGYNCFAHVAYCGVTGSVKGNGAVGGIIGIQSVCTALMNSYFAGTIELSGEDAFGGAFMGSLDTVETVVSNCYYIKATGLAPLGRFDNAQVGTYPPAEMYFDLDTVGGLGATAGKADVLALTKWNEASWDFADENDVTPAPKRNTAYTGVTVKLAFNGHAISLTDGDGETEKVDNELTTDEPVESGANLATVFYGLTGSFNGLKFTDAAENSRCVSGGYFVKGVRVPGAFLITDNTDINAQTAFTVDLAFVDYADVAGEYYFTSAIGSYAGQNYKLVLYSSGMAVAYDDDTVYSFVYYYTGKTTAESGEEIRNIIIIGQPDFIFPSTPVRVDASLPVVYVQPHVMIDASGYMQQATVVGGMYIPFFAAHAYSDVIGSWSASGGTYTFNVDRTGSFASTDGTSDFTFTWELVYQEGEETGIKLLNDVYKDEAHPDAEEEHKIAYDFGTGRTLVHEDESESETLTYNQSLFAGKTLESDMYSGRNSITLTGSESFTSSTVEVDSVEYAYDSGFLVKPDTNAVFGSQYGFAGTWYNATDNKTVVLGGLDIYGRGLAQLPDGKSYAYYVGSTDDAPDQTDYAGAAKTIELYFVKLNEDAPIKKAAIVAISATGEIVKFKYAGKDFVLSDVFYGGWYSTVDGTYYAFDCGQLWIGEATASVSYNYGNRTTATCNGNTYTYNRDDNGYEWIEVTGTETLKLVKGDMYADLELIADDGTVLHFNGLGEVNNMGEATFIEGSRETTYRYTFDPATGVATITNLIVTGTGTEGDNTTRCTVAYNPETGYFDVTPYYDGVAQTSASFQVGFYDELFNAFSGVWVGMDDDDSAIEVYTVNVGVFNAEGEAAASITVYDNEQNVVDGSKALKVKTARVVELGGEVALAFYGNRSTPYYVMAVFLEDGETVAILLDVDTEKQILLGPSDDLYGYWAKEDSMLYFDGTAASIVVGLVGDAVYASGQSEEELLYRLVGEDGDYVTCLAISDGESAYFRFVLFVLSDENPAQYAGYDYYEGVGRNGGYVLVLVPFANVFFACEEIEKDSTTYTFSTVTLDAYLQYGFYAYTVEIDGTTYVCKEGELSEGTGANEGKYEITVYLYEADGYTAATQPVKVIEGLITVDAQENVTGVEIVSISNVPAQ